MSLFAPTSPITPRIGSAESEVVELYEQDNIPMSSMMSKSSLTIQQELEQAGKFGLHLIEELKAKNQIIEDLANRLRMIYSSPNTPDLTVGPGSAEFLSNSFLSSIRGPSSSRTLSPVLPPGVLNDCMDRAEKEIARLEDLALTQTREVECLRQDLTSVTDVLASERDRFKEDRVKLKKEILELQVVIKRKDQFANHALVKAKDRLTSVSSGTQVYVSDLSGETDWQALYRDSEKRLSAVTRERDGYREQLKKPESQDEAVSVDFGDYDELTGLRETLDQILSKEWASVSSQTDLDWIRSLEDADERAKVYSDVIEAERVVYVAELARLQSILSEQDRKTFTAIGSGTECVRTAPVGVNTEAIETYSTATGEDFVSRFSEESAQTIPIDELESLVEENKKLKEKYLRYRSEFAAVVEKRKSAVPIGTNTDAPSIHSTGTITESDHTRAVDRGTSRTPQIVSDGVVQVDDDRDEKLFIVESDRTMLAEDREALLVEREQIMAELIQITQERDHALTLLEKAKKVVSVESVCVATDEQIVQSVSIATDAQEVQSTGTDPVQIAVPVESVSVGSPRPNGVSAGTDPVHIAVPVESVSVGTPKPQVESTGTDAVVDIGGLGGTPKRKVRSTGTDPVEFWIADVIAQLSTESAVVGQPSVDTGVGDDACATILQIDQSALIVCADAPRPTTDASVFVEDRSLEEMITRLETEIQEMKLASAEDQFYKERVYQLEHEREVDDSSQRVLQAEMEALRERSQQEAEYREKLILELQEEIASLSHRVGQDYTTRDSLEREIERLRERQTDSSSLTAIQEELCSRTPFLDTSDLSPASLAVRLDEYIAKGPSASSENQLIRSLQKRLMASERATKEKNEFFKFELSKLRQEVLATAVVKSLRDSSANTDFARLTDAGCNTEAVSINPVSPLPKLLQGDGSPKHPQARLDASDLVAYYQLGQSPFGNQQNASPEVDVSDIPKPQIASLTTNCSPPEGATFDFSISSLQHQTLSSLSPLRIPFTTPVAKDKDGDVVMKTAPRTQIRRSEFAVHQDAVGTIHEETEEESMYESAAAETVQTLQSKNGDMKKRLGSVRDKAMLIKSMTNKLWSLTAPATFR